MRKIIHGVAYDTEGAQQLFFGDHDNDASQAWWALYKKPDGSFFEVVADHDGSIDYFAPVSSEEARAKMERSANNLVEEHFGRMPEIIDLRFSRDTRNAAIEILESKVRTHGDMTRLFLRISSNLAERCNDGSMTDRWNHLIKYLDKEPLAKLESGSFMIDVIVEEAAKFVTDEEFSREDKHVAAFLRALRLDGFDIEGNRIRRILPNELGISQAKDEVSRLLNKHGLTILRGHLDQALDAHSRGDWASANAQLRAFYEGLFEEIAIRLDPSSKQLASSENRRARLAAIGFLDETLNEWSADGKNFVNGLFKRLHPAGSHPGLSDEADSTFRRHIVLITARLFLSRFDSWPP